MSTDTPDSQSDVSQNDHVESAAGPDVLAERPLLGIFVHTLALWIPFGGGVLAAGAIYRLTDQPFTCENARNALNWYLTVLAIVVGLLITFGTAAVLEDIPYVGAAAFLISLPFFLAAFVATALTLVYWILATGKAIFGTAWRYPLSYEFLDRD